MKLACLFKKHWPVAAYAPHRQGFQLSRCVDCGHPMIKADGAGWRAMPQRLVRRAGRRGRRAGPPPRG